MEYVPFHKRAKKILKTAENEMEKYCKNEQVQEKIYKYR